MTTRHMHASTTLGDELKFKSLEGVEKLSDLFHYTVDLVAERCDLDLEQLLGTMLDIRVEIEQGKRYFQGLITQVQYLAAVDTNDREHIYRFEVNPWLWLATQNTDNRIFQNLTVPAIIEKVLTKYPFSYELQLQEDYREWPYCVQYDESDFHFISRLMELEGIYYCFEHQDGNHKLCLVDSSSAHKTLPGATSLINYHADDQSIPSHGPIIRDWAFVDSLYSNTHTMIDYDFEKSSLKLDVSYSLNKNRGKTMEVYEPLVGYFELDDGEKYVRVAAESEAWKSHTITAVSNYPLLSCGHTFEVERLRAAENPYLIIGTEFKLAENLYATDGGAESTGHQMQVTLYAMPHHTQFRAPKITPIPKAQGPMTAKVVGIQGEEIWTDQYGRIKVQFHWDREGRYDDNSSCWLRVSSPWAGGGFGGVQIPRINDEVIVGFVGGQLDRPMVVGRVYNAENMPALDFPANATQSGTVTRSKFGDSSTANSMLLEDKPGAEMLGFQAQKDMDALIKNNEDINVAGQQLGEHGGATDLSVGGFDDNIFKAASTESNLANQVRAILGKSDETVNGPRSHQIGSDAMITMQRGFVQNVVGGLANYTYGAGRDRTVETDYTHSADSTVTRKVSGSETSTVGSGYSKTVSDGPMEIESGPTEITVSGDTVIDSKVNHDSEAGANVTVMAPSLGQSAPTVTEQYQNEILITGFKELMALQSTSRGDFSIGISGISEAMQVNKLNLAAIKVGLSVKQAESSQLKGEIMGVKLKVVGRKGQNTVVKNELTGITIDNP
ncbi:MAG: type VI secretion system tip protein TssI/VgrG [Alcaligenaceae bacterium]|nr:type VI secretion system tip protein TssI/VgrG [Alcaligenaceae bacterium]